MSLYKCVDVLLSSAVVIRALLPKYNIIYCHVEMTQIKI